MILRFVPKFTSHNMSKMQRKVELIDFFKKISFLHFTPKMKYKMPSKSLNPLSFQYGNPRKDLPFIAVL